MTVLMATHVLVCDDKHRPVLWEFMSIYFSIHMFIHTYTYIHMRAHAHLFIYLFIYLLHDAHAYIVM